MTLYIVPCITAIVIENLESENDDMEVQVATLDMSRDEDSNSPIPGQVSRPSIIELAETMYKPEASSSKLILKEEHLRYSFSKLTFNRYFLHNFKLNLYQHPMEDCYSGFSSFGQCSPRDFTTP